MPFTAAKLGAVQGSVIVARRWAGSRLIWAGVFSRLADAALRERGRLPMPEA